MTDELEQMSPNQRRAVDKALSALETFAAIWAAEISLGAMSARIAAVPNEAERAKRIAAMIEQGFIEGAYRHYLDHKDKCDELEAARATAEQSRSDAWPVAVTVPVPTERGVYAWIAEGSASLVLVHTRPSDHSPGGVMKATNIRNCTFYEGCPVEQWHGGTWYGPLTKDALKSQQDADIESKPVELPTMAAVLRDGSIATNVYEAFENGVAYATPSDTTRSLLVRLAALKRYRNKLKSTGEPSGNYATLSVPISLLEDIDAAIESQRSGDGS